MIAPFVHASHISKKNTSGPARQSDKPLAVGNGYLIFEIPLRLVDNLVVIQGRKTSAPVAPELVKADFCDRTECDARRGQAHTGLSSIC